MDRRRKLIAASLSFDLFRKVIDARLRALHILFRGAGTQADSSNHLAIDNHWQAATNHARTPCQGRVNPKHQVARNTDLIIFMRRFAGYGSGESFVLSYCNAGNVMLVILPPSMRSNSTRFPDSSTIAIHIGTPIFCASLFAPSIRYSASDNESLLMDNVIVCFLRRKSLSLRAAKHAVEVQCSHWLDHGL